MNATVAQRVRSVSEVPAARVIYPERPGQLTRRPADEKGAPRALLTAGRAPLAARPAPLRLTRRGRVVLTVLAALVIAAISMVAAGVAQASNHAGPAGRAGIVRVTVRPGQSLWAIAEGRSAAAGWRSTGR